MKVKRESEVTQLYLTLHDTMDCNLPGSVQGIFQARVLEWAAIAFSAMKETMFQFLGQEDALKKVKATHSVILAWRNPWTEDPGRLQSMGYTHINIFLFRLFFLID